MGKMKLWTVRRRLPTRRERNGRLWMYSLVRASSIISLVDDTYFPVPASGYDGGKSKASKALTPLGKPRVSVRTFDLQFKQGRKIKRRKQRRSNSVTMIITIVFMRILCPCNTDHF